MKRIEGALRQKGTPTAPVPTELTKPEHFLKFDATNMRRFDPTGYKPEDLPPQTAFQKAGMAYFTRVHGYLSFKIKNAPNKKRQLDNEEEKAKRLKSGDCDLAFQGLGRTEKEASGARRSGPRTRLRAS